jgi:peptide/nickel transport system permease protein
MTAQSAEVQLSTRKGRRVSRSFWNAVGHRLLHDPITMGCLVILLLIAGAAIVVPWISPHDVYKTSISKRLVWPGDSRFLLGTDELGRDMLTRILYGGRLSLVLGISPVLIATAIGGSLGIVAGYVGGKLNMAVMRVIDIFYAFPSVLLAVAISGFLGGGVTNMVTSLTLVFIPPIARVAEGVATQIRGQDYVEAARASGAAEWRIVVSHIIPNVLTPILIYASSLISVSIVLASGLSFLGLGTQPPEPEWGLMLNTLRQSIYVAPLNAIIPGFMIFVTSMCFNLMSDGFRSAMDVKQ